jgi:hypothetical protein
LGLTWSSATAAVIILTRLAGGRGTVALRLYRTRSESMSTASAAAAPTSGSGTGLTPGCANFR